MTTKRDAFSPDQERDENGRWTSTGSGDNASEIKKAAGGGIHELKRTERGTIQATHSKGGRTSHMGEYSTPEKAKEAIAKHEVKVKERLRTTGANSARVHNQVTEGIHANREARNQLMGSPVVSKTGRPMSAKTSQLIRESEERTAKLKAGTAALKEKSAATRQATREVKAIGKEAKAIGKEAKAVGAKETEAAREERLQFVAKWGGNASTPEEMARVQEIKKEREAAFWKGPPQAALKPGEVDRLRAKEEKSKQVQEVLENLRASPEYKALPTAGRSAQLVKERQAEANKQGFADFNGGRGVGRAPSPGRSGARLGRPLTSVGGRLPPNSRPK